MARRRRDCNDLARARGLSCSMRGASGIGSAHRRPRDHRAGRWLGGNGRSLRGSHDGGGLARLRHNSARSRSCNGLRRRGDRRRAHYSGSLCRDDRGSCDCRCRSAGVNPLHRSCRRGGGDHRSSGCRARRRRSSFFFFLLDCLQYVAGFRNARPVDLRFGRSGFDALIAGCAALAALEVSAHTLGFVEL